MTSNSALKLRTRIAAMPVREPPPPWRRLQVHIGGVAALGFGRASDSLLVLSHSGTGVLDCTTGEVVARDTGTEPDDDPYPVERMGIGPLQGEIIRLSGLWGGGLRTMTADGWVVHRASPDWPLECAILCPPDSPELVDDISRATMLLRNLDMPLRAFGFSDTGRTLVASTSILNVWTR